MGMKLGLATHAMIDLVSFPYQTRVVVTPTQWTTEEENYYMYPIFEYKTRGLRAYN